MGVENIPEHSIQNELKSGKSFWYKHDKQGRAILYIRVRYHDPSGAEYSEVALWEGSLLYHSNLLWEDGTVHGVEL